MSQIYADEHGSRKLDRMIHKMIIRHEDIIIKAGIIGIIGRLILKIVKDRELKRDISLGLIADGRIDKITADKEGVIIFQFIKPIRPAEYIKIDMIINQGDKNNEVQLEG